MVDYLKENGFTDVFGYDPFSVKYSAQSVLNEPFDLVIAQDVIEHDPQPLELMAKLSNLVKPGGRLVIGTPRADGVDFSIAKDAIHTLHAPFHLHIFSEKQLLECAKKFHLKCEAIYRQHYVNSKSPFLNWSFVRAYVKRLGNVIDPVFEPINMKLIFMSPELLIKGLFGYYFKNPQQDMLLILKK